MSWKVSAAKWALKWLGEAVFQKILADIAQKKNDGPPPA